MEPIKAERKKTHQRGDRSTVSGHQSHSRSQPTPPHLRVALPSIAALQPLPPSLCHRTSGIHGGRSCPGLPPVCPSCILPPNPTPALALPHPQTLDPVGREIKMAAAALAPFPSRFKPASKEIKTAAGKRFSNPKLLWRLLLLPPSSRAPAR
ncbi:hypothetical protein BRADI_5g20456v3 [Brachypodium distachyon]|uniref:Uncharacterized protein n=1 Tax=Brachypodium distachyon TaxID=15368 RepID=A0A0Q3GTM7_BRADI|nr:hypothetical protein BRADI_5g20456v3 [Brachypodium distachyon]